VTPERLAPEWRKRAALLGLDAARLERLVRPRHRNQDLGRR
jgi:hypothetical protein